MRIALYSTLFCGYPLDRLLRVSNDWLFLTTIGINCVLLNEEKPI